MGGPLSYVELLSCIKVLRDACGANLAWLRPTTWSSYARICDSNSSPVRRSDARPVGFVSWSMVLGLGAGQDAPDPTHADRHSNEQILYSVP
jgi:hypothetical protein